MGVLFLDHYGVMVLSNRYYERKKGKLPSAVEFIDVKIPDNFNPDAVKTLNTILSKSDVEIVVTSDWKNKMTLGEMVEFYNVQGISKSPISYTKIINENGLSIFKRKSIEILNFVEINNIDRWVVIDDLYLGDYLSNFVWCRFPNMGILEDGIMDKIIEMFISSEEKESENI